MFMFLDAAKLLSGKVRKFYNAETTRKSPVFHCCKKTGGKGNLTGQKKNIEQEGTA